MNNLNPNCKYLDLEDYRSLIELDEEFGIASPVPVDKLDALVEINLVRSIWDS